MIVGMMRERGVCVVYQWTHYARGGVGWGCALILQCHYRPQQRQGGGVVGRGVERLEPRNHRAGGDCVVGVVKSETAEQNGVALIQLDYGGGDQRVALFSIVRHWEHAMKRELDPGGGLYGQGCGWRRRSLDGGGGGEHGFVAHARMEQHHCGIPSCVELYECLDAVFILMLALVSTTEDAERIPPRRRLLWRSWELRSKLRCCFMSML